MTGRAAEIAANTMRADGWGDPPAPWCVLILGSGGRGESALAPDQDNAIVHAGGDADDAWFAEAGARMARILDAAGLPLCKGGVMAKNPEWRRTEAGWRDEIDRWIRKKEGEALLSVDIFFDFAPAFGDRTLADALRRDALAAAQRSPLFLRLLAAELEERGSALGPFGFLRTEQGRVDIKRGGTMPIVAAARVMTMKHGIDATGTRERLARLVGCGVLGSDDADRLSQALGILIGLMLEQQIADLADGRAPSTRIDPKRLVRSKRRALKDALRACENTAAVVQGPLSQTSAMPSGAP
jgi:signal-transduction protein with cAMP-binding, CBS, and nucleotidyltransferase domain